MKKESSLSKLFAYAGKFRYLTIASWILSVISAWLALVPFYYIWRIMKEVLSVASDFGKAAHLKEYGWGSRWICHFIHAGLCVRADVFPSGSIPRPGKYPHQPDAAYPDTANGIFR